MTFEQTVVNYQPELTTWNADLPLPQRVYAGIHLNNICHNVQWYMDHTGPDTKTMAVIKTDAYGHGAVMVRKPSRRSESTHSPLPPSRRAWNCGNTA